MNARAGLALFAWLVAANPTPACTQSASSTVSAPAPAAEAEAVRTGLQALTRGQTAVTLVVATTPLATLQERLFAESKFGGKRSVLLVLQAMDTAGKGGIIRHVVGGVDPQGVHGAMWIC